MNLIKLLALILTNKVKAAAEWVKDNIDLSLRLLYLSIGLPLLLTLIGLLVAGLSDNVTAIAVGRGLIIISGMVSSMFLTLFWVRATVLVDIIVYATKGANLVSDKVKALDTEQAEKFISWLRGVTTWITAVWLYVMIVPIWRNLEITAVVLTCIVFFSGVMSSRWFNRPTARKVVTFAVVMIFLFGTLAVISPAFVGGVKDLANSFVGDVTAKHERQERLSGVRQEARREATDLDKILLKKLADRQQQIRRRAVELCGGRFCSDQEAREYGQIEQDIGRISDGTYWQQASQAPEPVSSRAVVPQNLNLGDASSVDLPPPTLPRRQTLHVPHRTDRAESLDDVFRELEKYPDL